MNKIMIEELRLDTVIGVYAWEQKIKQRVTLTLELGVDTKAAAKSDDLKNTVDYQALCDRIIDYVQSHSHQLLETLAHRIIHLMQSEFNIKHIKLKLSKPNAIQHAKNISVELSVGTFN